MLGQTRTRTTVSALDQEAMNTVDPTRLAQLCDQGSNLACKFANMPVPTEEQKAEWAANRDAQAEADRAALSQRLLNVGVNPIIASAVRSGRDIYYAKDEADAAAFEESLKPWHNRKSTWIIAGVAMAGIATALYFYA